MSFISKIIKEADDPFKPKKVSDRNVEYKIQKRKRYEKVKELQIQTKEKIPNIINPIKQKLEEYSKFDSILFSILEILEINEIPYTDIIFENRPSDNTNITLVVDFKIYHTEDLIRRMNQSEEVDYIMNEIKKLRTKNIQIFVNYKCIIIEIKGFNFYRSLNTND